MPKRSDKRDAAKSLYLSRRKQGDKVNLKNLADELEVPYTTVRRWKGEDHWEDDVPRKRGGQPKNHNAKGNRGGGAPKRNKNAEKDGAYSKIFFDQLSEDDLVLIEHTPLESNEALRHEMQILKLQEKKILDSITKYESLPEDELHISSLMDMRVPGSSGEDGANQKMGMYTKETPFVRITKLRDALYKVQGRIASTSNALRQAEEFSRRMALEERRLEIMRMRATGGIEVEGDEEGDDYEAVYD
jgi:hypothetical protein